MFDTIQRAIRSYLEAREQRARRRVIEMLDERTLRDIGLEAEANRARDRVRFRFMQFGMY
jgi:uncharacterized protein YjiS (DUF1127 family)